MEISVGNSGGSKTRSLDLKTLYKSEVSNKEAPVNKGKSSWLGNGEEAETKKRKHRKEVAISSFEDLTERKKIRPSINDIEIDGADTCSAQPSGIGQKINGGNGFNAIGIHIGGDGHSLLIPKRPRGSVGRSKFAKNHLLKPSAASGSVEKVTKLKDELKEVMQNEVSGRGEPMGSNSSAEQNVKLNGKSAVKARRKQKGVVGLKGSQKQELAAITSSQHEKSNGGDLVKPTGSLGSKDQVAKLKYEIKEIPQNKVPGADAHLNSSSLGSKDQVDKLKYEIKEIPQNNFPGADAPLSSNSTSSDQMGMLNENCKGKIRNNAKKKAIDDLDGNQKQKEDLAVAGSSQLVTGEGNDLVVNNKDSSFKRNNGNRRKRKMSGSGGETVSKKVESSIEKKVGTCDLDPDDDLEQNAARMLSSRFDPSCTGFASRSRTSALSSPSGASLLEKPTANAGSEGPMTVSDPASADTADRVLRPRRQQKGKGTSRQRRHFYEIHSDDMDAHWFLNRRIKIFWPLDESWYYGLVNDYDAEKNLHHIKYDDRDEEWISLENERFKLLLLPSEVPHKTSHKDTVSVDTHKEGSNEDKGSRAFRMNDETFMASHMESEPIISWLARSSHRVKSSPSTSLKKQKLSHFSSEPLQLSDNSIDVYKNGNMGLLERETDKPNCSAAFLNISADRRKNEESVPENTNSSEGHVPIVYVRRRYRRFSDAARVLFVNNNGCVNPSGHTASLSLVFQSSAEGSNFLSCLGPGELHWSLNSAGVLKLDTTFLERKKFKICIPRWPMLTYILGVDILWLIHSVLLLQYGTMVTMWPTVVLEVLFVDNIVGLRLFIFEGCLKQAVAFVFLVMKVFCEREKDESIGQKIPVTSIRFKLTFFQNLIKQKVFTYYSFSEVRYSNWQYLDSEFQPHCLLTKQLSLPECTYDNIKLLEAMQHSQLPYAGQTTYFEVFRKRSNPGAVPLFNRSRSSYPVSGSRPSTIYSLKHGNLPPFALSFTAAPNFFLSLHLKLLLERSITSVSLQDHDSVHSLHYPRDIFHPLANDCSHGEDQFDIFSESSCKNHEKMSSFEAAGSEVVSTSSRLCKDAAVISIDGDLRKSSQLVLDAKLNVNRTSLSSKATQTVPVENGNSDKYEANVKGHALLAVSGAKCSSNLKGISVEIPTSDEVYRDCRKTPGAQQVSDLTWNLSDGIICSPNPTGPRSLWHRNKSGSSSSSFGGPFHAWPDGKADFIGNGFGNGPKKPRTQVQYTLPSREFNFKNKGHNLIGLPYQRIRKANDKRTSDSSKGPRRNLELVACDANILINGGDKGWRECGARVFLEVADQNEWKLAVKCSGELRYSYKVHQDLQPGSTNRYTHAMMWKGGKDWAIEFPDRSQWFLFKEMHEECHNRNIRAASIKNIPIPGVRMIEDSVDDQDEMPFIRSPWYFRQVRNDVEMAMDGSHVIYDMDSEDEEWISRSRASSQMQGGEDDMISHEIFEKVMDMLEKVSYAQKRDRFTSGEIDELIARVSPMQVAKSIYEHWREKRLRKGMPLIRQLQPPLWERYQQICREWDELNPKLTTGSVTGSLEKASAGDKPPMFAFCLKPRGLELLNKGSKHRPHKKISLSGHSHAFLGDHDSHHSSGRRVNSYALGDETSDVSPLLTKMYSSRDPGHLSLEAADASADWNHQLRIQRHNPKSIRAVVSPKMAVASSTLRKAAVGNGKRNNGKKLNNAFADWHNQPSRQLLLGGSDLDEFRLRDASSAAKHARNMAKLKRERAQKLMLSADLAIHKAVSALMTAEAIKACTEAASHGRSVKSTSLPPSPS
ncbi:hypothetical protein L6452_18418 [Arctium lappa]|uniref:Uncharacterized protein n=1 Tax=Arctium lappa TaxID=4217 RepID=A0ACB9C6F5_ARCLA|nr:hypothetical protein L6452_18418 [Arctium lappa]